MSLSPDGRYVVYDRSVKEHNEFHRIFMLDIHSNGEEVPLLEDCSGDDYYPVCAPDGKTIVFVAIASLVTARVCGLRRWLMASHWGNLNLSRGTRVT